MEKFSYRHDQFKTPTRGEIKTALYNVGEWDSPDWEKEILSRANSRDIEAVKKDNEEINRDPVW